MLGNSPVKKLDFTDKENKAPVEGEDVFVEKALTVTPAKPLTRAEEIKVMEADEPLLRENKSRYVLFPLKYHEVSHLHARSGFQLANSFATDLADVQEGRGFILDR